MLGGFSSVRCSLQGFAGPCPGGAVSGSDKIRSFLIQRGRKATAVFAMISGKELEMGVEVIHFENK